MAASGIAVGVSLIVLNVVICLRRGAMRRLRILLVGLVILGVVSVSKGCATFEFEFKIR